MGRGAANAGLSDAHYIDNHGGVPVGLDGAALAPICAQHGLAPRAWILPRPAPTNASTSNRTTRPLLTAGQHAVRPPRVFDCALLTTASAEVLELRMHELDSVVDRFVVRASPHQRSHAPRRADQSTPQSARHGRRPEVMRSGLTRGAAGGAGVGGAALGCGRLSRPAATPRASANRCTSTRKGCRRLCAGRRCTWPSRTRATPRPTVGPCAGRGLSVCTGRRCGGQSRRRGCGAAHQCHSLRRSQIE